MAGKTVTYSRLELLDLARRPDPDRDVARAALARLRPGTKARFYAELRDPAWIGLLADAGMFAAPPAAVRDGDTVRFPDWPEGLVLLAFADGAPEAVARTAAQVPSSDNARVAQLLARIAAALPAELVVDHGLARRVAQDLNGQARLFDVAEPAESRTARSPRRPSATRAARPGCPVGWASSTTLTSTVQPRVLRPGGRRMAGCRRRCAGRRRF